MAINVAGHRSMAFEACCRCGQERRQQNMCCHEIDGELRWFCVDCSCQLAADLANDVHDLVRVRQIADRTHEARDAVLGEYAALGLMTATAG